MFLRDDVFVDRLLFSASGVPFFLAGTNPPSSSSYRMSLLLIFFNIPRFGTDLDTVNPEFFVTSDTLLNFKNLDFIALFPFSSTDVLRKGSKENFDVFCSLVAGIGLPVSFAFVSLLLCTFESLGSSFAGFPLDWGTGGIGLGGFFLTSVPWVKLTAFWDPGAGFLVNSLWLCAGEIDCFGVPGREVLISFATSALPGRELLISFDTSALEGRERPGIFDTSALRGLEVLVSLVTSTLSGLRRRDPVVRVVVLDLELMVSL